MALTTFQLEGEADQWWRSVKNIRTMKDWTWSKFENLLMEKYSSMPMPKFNELIQNHMMAGPHANHFEALSREKCEGIVNEEHKAWLFEKDLKIANDEETVTTQSMPHTRAVGQALVQKEEINGIRSSTSQNYKAKQSQSESSRNIKRKHNHQPYDQEGQRKEIRNQEDGTSGKKIHHENYWHGKCFHCQHTGHRRRNCPQLQRNVPNRQGDQNDGHGKRKGRCGNQKKRLKRRRKRFEGDRSGRCYHCGQIGHREIECLQRFEYDALTQNGRQN